MRVIVEQSGGFVGYTRRGVDTADLTPAEAAELETLVRQANLDAAARSPGPPPGNTPTHSVTVESDQGARQTILDHQDPAARPLLDFLKRHGKPLPPP